MHLRAFTAQLHRDDDFPKDVVLAHGNKDDLGSLAVRDGDCRREGVERVAEEGVVAGDEAPLVLTDIVDLARHVIVTTDHIDFVLEEEGLMADTELVHRV